MNNSNSDTDDRLLYACLAFSGEITASVTHELNNVLGTIDQVAGLFDDLAATPTAEVTVATERLKTLADRVDKQTERGITLIKRLNAFAHMGDHITVECNLNDVIENLTNLTQRIANMQRIELKTSLPNHSIMVTTNPLLLSHVLFLCIKRALSLGDRDEVLNVRLSQQDEKAEVTIEVQCGDAVSDSSNDGDLSNLLSRIPAEVSELISDGRLSINVIVPIRHQ
ncbi:MAG: hypothetical protein ABII79_00850 [bacterium]